MPNRIILKANRDRPLRHKHPWVFSGALDSVVGEETGFLGAAVVTLLYLTLVLRGVKVAHRARNRFGSLVAIGMTSIFLYHILVNICMTVGLAPVTGLPLPLLSYGGTSLLTSFLQIGLIQNVAMRWREY